MAVVLKCPLLYADAYSRGGGAGAQGFLIVDIYNPMPVQYEVWVALMDSDWVLWRSEHTIIGAGETMRFEWSLTIGKNETFAVAAKGDPWPAPDPYNPTYRGDVEIVHIIYHP